MCRNRHSLLAVAMLFQLCWVCQTIAEETEWVCVVPEETDEILPNPGMGWETFHKTVKQDKNLPAWIPSTIHYARWGWNVLEPELGKIDYDFLDGILKETREAGQQLAFRVMCCSPYRVAYRLSNGQGYAKVFVRTATVDHWPPGSIELFTDEFFKEPADLPPGKIAEVSDTISLPDDLSPGTYTLSPAIVGEENTEPVVQLGIVGRSENGWYPLSTISMYDGISTKD